MPPTNSQIKSLKVAIIGAGAAGLVSARELRREGHEVVVFERQAQLGGTWLYDSRIEADPLGADPSRAVIHSSLYASLRTNLPRESMGFRAYPFLSTAQSHPHRDSRRFPGHQEVLLYLNDYATEFGLTELVRFETEVVRAGLVEDGKWRVRSRREDENGGAFDVDEIFDALVVSNGHYTQPLTAEIPGIDGWPGKQMHSHSYRVPEPYRDLVVILIGSGPSALDISVDIVQVAKEVHVASRSAKVEVLRELFSCHNIQLHPMIERVQKDGTVIFDDGSMVLADVILHCTGYKYHLPFLDTNGIVTVEDNCVGPLYKHIFPPLLAPRLSFVGLPSRALPFPMFEFQSKWIAGALSGRIELPSEKEMMEDVSDFYLSLEATGTPKRHTHQIGAYPFEYNDWLAAECGIQGTEEWRKKMFHATLKNCLAHSDTYRDAWEDEDLVLEARMEMATYCLNS